MRERRKIDGRAADADSMEGGAAEAESRASACGGSCISSSGSFIALVVALVCVRRGWWEVGLWVDYIESLIGAAPS